MDNKKLITEIHKRQNLWDPTSPGYNSRDLRSNDWTMVAEEMQSSVKEVKNRWKLLRDSFNRELRKIPKNSGEKINFENASKWVHFKDMLFLKDELATPAVDGSSKSLTEEFGPGINESLDKALNILEQRSVPYEAEEINDDHMAYISLKQTESPARKRKTQRQMDHNFLNFIEEGEKHEVNSQSEQSSSNSEDYHFLMSLLPSLEQLPPRKKFITKIEIQKLIYEAMFEEPIPNGKSSSDNSANEFGFSPNARIKYEEHNS
ncbi:hypothetical protein Avbf_02703 [Armadillidium vulgare]|nr:hypothetical protein Avbf_02703 [Armadillidium vulgare]